MNSRLNELLINSTKQLNGKEYLEYLKSSSTELTNTEKYLCALLGYAFFNKTSPEAMFSFGKICNSHDIINYNAQMSFVEKAASMGYGPALEYLANVNMSYNTEKALQYYLKCLNCTGVDLGKINLEISKIYFDQGNKDCISYAITASEKYNIAYADYLLASVYFNGYGVETSRSIAAKYCIKAADNGCAEAQFWIGKEYYIPYELELEEDIEKARHYLLLSYEQGNNKAAAFLGLMYYYGDGFEKDKEKARFYLSKAENEGVAFATAYLGQIYYEEGLYIIAEQKLSDSFFNNEGNWFVSSLADIYMNGLSGDVDISKAIKCYEYLINNKEANEDDILFVADSYRLGNGVIKDIDKAVEYYLLIEYSNAFAKMQLGKIALQELSSRLKKNDCIKYLDSAGGNGFSQAYLDLGNYFESINNFDRALDYYTRAFNSGCVEGAYHAGRIMELGTPTKQKSLAEAYQWYKKGADAGCDKSANELSHIKSTIFGYRRF